MRSDRLASQAVPAFPVSFSSLPPFFLSFLFHFLFTFWLCSFSLLFLISFPLRCILQMGSFFLTGGCPLFICFINLLSSFVSFRFFELFNYFLVVNELPILHPFSFSIPLVFFSPSEETVYLSFANTGANTSHLGFCFSTQCKPNMFNTDHRW